MAQTIQVLLIHPDPGGAVDLWECLVSACGEPAPRRARSLEEAAAHLAASDAVLLSLAPGDESGIGTLRGVRQAAPGAAVIVVVARGEDDLTLSAVREGAHDCLITEGLSAPALSRSIRHAVERGRLEQALRAREEFSRRVIENMPGGLVHVGADGAILEANAQAERFLGLRREELRKRSVRDYEGETIAEDGRPLPVERYPVTRAMTTGHATGPETIGVRRPDGALNWGVFSATPLLGESGRPAGAVVTFVDITERRRAEQALRESEERFRAMADSAPMLVWMTDAEGRETYYNRTWLEYTGESLPGALDHGWRRALHPEDQGRCLEVFEEARRRRGPFKIEYRLRRADGSYGWVLDHGSPRFSPDGAYTGHIGSCADITERKKAEELLVASEATQRALLEAIPDLLFRMDRHGTYLGYSGPKGAPLLAEPASFLGKRAMDVLGAQHGGLLQSVIDKALTTRAVQTYEYTAGTDETPRYHEVRVVPCGQDDVLAVVRNITTRKRTEAALLESEERYRSLVETSPDGIIVHQEGRIVLANDRMAHLLGMRRGADLVGTMAIDLVHPEDRDLVRKRQDFIHRTGEPVPPAVERLLGADGRTVWAEIAASPCIHRARAAVQVVVRDIAERRRLEEDLRRAQKLQAVGQLASGVAHDFNNLLTAIFGYTSLARRTLPTNHPAHRSLERVEEAARQAGGVTRALLTFSRNTPGDKRPVVLADVVQEAVRLLRRTLPANIRLQTDLDTPGPAWVDADATQLQQVVLNLAINARDAMPAGGKLTVALEADEPRSPKAGSATLTGRASSSSNQDSGGTSCSRVRLRVSDTGVGMTPEVEARIFDPFFTTKPPEQGTGLGLAIVHGIVQDHGGTITVRTAPGRGSTFTVELPCVPAGGGSAQEPAPLDAPAGRGETILLVEDHAYVRELIASMLVSSGYQVVQAASGEGLMHALRAGAAPRLLILDRGLPDGPGETWIPRARAAAGPLPVVLLVGVGPDDPAPGAGEATIIVRKPFQLSDLMAAVARGLGRRTPEGAT